MFQELVNTYREFLVSISFLCGGCGLFLFPVGPWETFSFPSPSLILSSFIHFYRYNFMACLDFVVCFSIQDFCWSMQLKENSMSSIYLRCRCYQKYTSLFGEFQFDIASLRVYVEASIEIWWLREICI